MASLIFISSLVEWLEVKKKPTGSAEQVEKTLRRSICYPIKVKIAASGCSERNWWCDLQANFPSTSANDNFDWLPRWILLHNRRRAVWEKIRFGVWTQVQWKNRFSAAEVLGEECSSGEHNRKRRKSGRQGCWAWLWRKKRKFQNRTIFFGTKWFARTHSQLSSIAKVKLAWIQRTGETVFRVQF